MITQATSRASPPALQAAVEWADVRTPSRVSRRCLAAVLLSLAAAGWLWGIPGSPLKAASAALVLLAALLDGRARSPLAALSVDALCLTAAAGSGAEVHGPLVGAVGFLVAAAVLLLPLRRAPLPLAALGIGVALRLVVLPLPPGGGTAPAPALAAVESAVYLIALFLLGLGTARTMHLSRLRQTHALEAEQRAAQIKDEFASKVSHELRTPLTNIAGFSLALRDSWRTFDPAEVDEFLDLVCRETDHLRALVDDMLVVPRLAAGRLLIEPADFSLGPAVFRIASLVFPSGGEKSVSVSVGGGAVVRADPNRVEQVLRNLLDNAAKHGGPQVSIEATPLGSEWQVTVADDGPGIDAAHRDRVFAAYEQATPTGGLGQGLGLGLTVSRVLVEAMGGRIWYEPGFPTGARFCFTLPAAASRQGVPVPVAS